MEENELRWLSALGAWRLRDRQPLADLLLDESFAPPADMRHFLSDLVLGKVTRQQGRPSEYSGKVERSIAHDVFTEYQRLKALPRANRVANPQEAAWQLVADKRQSTYDSIRGVMSRMKKVGITFEWWSANKPDWKLRT